MSGVIDQSSRNLIPNLELFKVMVEEKQQTIDDIVNIVSSVIETEPTTGFTIHYLPHRKNRHPNEYYEKDLTTSYIKLVKDIFNLKYGEINREVIKCFGDTIKTSETQFKSSYRTTIKEIIEDKIYVHTSLNKLAIRKTINSLSKVLNFKVIHKYSKSEIEKIV